MTVAIITTAHWEGDARLNRHVGYLQQAGLTATIHSHAGETRIRAFVSALRQIASKPAAVVILPDPELFFLGSLVARMRGLRAIIDIHEDYARVARGRDWIPRPLEAIVGLLARAAVGLGRLIATEAMAAAPDIAGRDDTVVTNVPDPVGMEAHSRAPVDRHTLVYVGDVTEARGSAEMIEVIRALGPGFTLRIVGHVNEGNRAAMTALAEGVDVVDRIGFEGRLPLERAWSVAAGSVAGLNLLRDLPAYRTAVATKLWEYMAAGIPPVVTNLPGQAAIVAQVDSRLVCSSPADAAKIIRTLAEDRQLRDELVARGSRLAREAWDETRPDLALRRVVSPDR